MFITARFSDDSGFLDRVGGVGWGRGFVVWIAHMICILGLAMASNWVGTWDGA